MIQQEQALKIIESKKCKKLKRSDFSNFSSKYKELGFIITKLSKEYQDKHMYYTPDDANAYEALFGSKIAFNPFNTEEGKRLALLIFGEHQGPLIPQIWDLILQSPYQSGFYRRAFRCKQTSKYNVNRIKYLQSTYMANVTGYAKFDIQDLIRYDVYGEGYLNDYSYIFAACLNNETTFEATYQLIHDIFQGEDDIGGVTRSIIKGLLLTNTPKNWKLVENLLLAAQRQEGLRQTILEALDETSIGALQHFIKVIIDHNLARFSSVIRAVDTWFGFGWEAPKAATINNILKTAHSYFNDPSLITTALKSKNNLEVYTALWFLALEDVDKANLEAITLIQSGSKDKKLVACMFINQTERSNLMLLDWVNTHFQTDLELDYWLLRILPDNPKVSNTLFEQIKAYGNDVPTKGKLFESTIFSWSQYTIKPSFFYNFLVTHANEEQQQILAQDLSKIPSEERSQFIRKLFPDHYTWYFQYHKTQKAPNIKFAANDWRKAVIHQAIKDRNESVMGTGLRLFQSMTLEQDDVLSLESLLARKHKTLRENIIQLILEQPEKTIVHTTSNLLASKKIDQRLGGLEILVELKEQNKMVSFVQEQVASYTTRPKLSKNEEVYIEKFEKKRDSYSFENGFGAIDYDNLSKIITPTPKFDKSTTNILSSILSKITLKSGFLFKSFIDEEKTTKALNALIALYKKHENHEYKITDRDGLTEHKLLANDISLIDYKAYDLDDPKEKIKYVPLYDVWQNWYDQYHLNDFEMLAANYYCNHFHNPFHEDHPYKEVLKPYIPNLKGIQLENNRYWNSLNNKISKLLSFFMSAYADHYTTVQFKLDVLEDLIAKFPKPLKTKVIKDQWGHRESYWFDTIENVGFCINSIEGDLTDFPKDMLLLKRFWDLKMYLAASSINYPNAPYPMNAIAKTNISDRNLNLPPAWISIKLYNEGQITEDDYKYQLLANTQLLRITEDPNSRKIPNLQKSDVPCGIFDQLKQHLLSLELERGDLPTEASSFMNNITHIEGSHYLFELLTRLGKDGFHRGYSWYSVSSKKEVFSRLIKVSTPKEDEHLHSFIETAKALKIPKKKWIETAMYAPQWAGWISELLNIDKLEDAVWWFQAHASEYMNAEKETIVSRYSNVAREDFVRGVIDIDWFQNVYSNVGKQHWKLLHDAAKYISTGNGHRLVKLYSSVMLGEVKIRETLGKIKDKRDKDAVKALGLIPLSKANKKKDLLNRYNIFQDFLKESKQFGAQRQESEKNAVEIGLDNLARNAGYEDSIRFSWAMEGEAIQNIMEHSVVEIDNVVVSLIVDTQGKADLKVLKDGKSQKSIPAKIKKDKRITALQKHKSYIKKQYSRTRISLEKAMLSEEAFTLEELQNISKHPVVYAMMNKLLFYNKSKQTFGFLNGSQLMDHEGKAQNIEASDLLLIAHAFHLYDGVVWDLYQKYAFENKLVQPFKQLFRELYILTPDEIESKTKSFRYQGHQIQPQKTIALLRTKGWTVNHEEGLQKVYHKKGYIASIYAMADWFSPADIEAPTLEHISFHSRNSYESVPLKDIDPVTYSEVMRDLDLVVSVAHVGGVDPEASHSTLQMRAALARETARLFKADNVEVKERYILVKGKLVEYNIHLGSGVVSKNGLSLSIIPVHSQHRGRLFLPFIDDDPKSAEIISKMKLLSEDDKIKDPTILNQINKR